MASAMGDAAGPGCSAGDGAGIGVGTGARAKVDADGPEAAEGKVGITTPDKTPIIISY